MNVEDLVQQRIEAARQRAEREKRQRAELAAARTAGIGYRHAQKLYRQANRPTEETTVPAAIRSALCPSCRQERPARLLMTINISGSPHDLLKCGESACELLWCVRADRPRTAAA
ncbi:hypothetical protein ACIP4X_13945 [Streptomyces sp. NPDC088817]|uniref:hypothetical protein n=1 Tax=unclassified Streptomyces TaxID=2593676 RepID=UPI0037FF4074